MAEYTVNIFAQGAKANLYSIYKEGEAESEFGKFLKMFPHGCRYDKDIDKIFSWLERIRREGALERFFRPESSSHKGVVALPIDFGYKLRLYCLRLDDRTLIITGGGIKKTRAWQEDPDLASHVEFLMQVQEDIEGMILDSL